MGTEAGGLRFVEIAHQFDIDLARFFPDGDGPEGFPPSWMTFLDQDLERILRIFRFEWGRLPMSAEDEREAVIACSSVWAVLVKARLRGDGVVELFGIEPDLRPFD